MTANAPTILLIDDDCDQLEVLSGYIENAGYRVLSALSVVEGLDWLKQSDVDLIISDIHMPNSAGETLSWISEVKKKDNIPILLVSSGYLYSTDTALAQGADGFCSKSEIGSNLLRQISALVAKA